MTHVRRSLSISAKTTPFSNTWNYLGISWEWFLTITDTNPCVYKMYIFTPSPWRGISVGPQTLNCGRKAGESPVFFDKWPLNTHWIIAIAVEVRIIVIVIVIIRYRLGYSGCSTLNPKPRILQCAMRVSKPQILNPKP